MVYRLRLTKARISLLFKDFLINIKNPSNFNISFQSLEIIDQIKELKNLHDKGVLNDDEFKKAKDKLLK